MRMIYLLKHVSVLLYFLHVLNIPIFVDKLILSYLLFKR